MRGNSNGKGMTGTQVFIYDRGGNEIFSKPAIFFGKSNRQQALLASLGQQRFHQARLQVIDPVEYWVNFCVKELIAHITDHALFFCKTFRGINVKW